MQTLVLGAAEGLAARGEAFAAREMHAALRAAHHILFATRRRRLLFTVHFPAIAFEYPVSEQQAQHQKNEFRQELHPPNIECPSVPQPPPAVERRAHWQTKRGLLQAFSGQRMRRLGVDRERLEKTRHQIVSRDRRRQFDELALVEMRPPRSERIFPASALISGLLFSFSSA